MSVYYRHDPPIRTSAGMLEVEELRWVDERGREVPADEAVSVLLFRYSPEGRTIERLEGSRARFYLWPT